MDLKKTIEEFISKIDKNEIQELIDSLVSEYGDLIKNNLTKLLIQSAKITYEQIKAFEDCGLKRHEAISLVTSQLSVLQKVLNGKNT